MVHHMGCITLWVRLKKSKLGLKVWAIYALFMNGGNKNMTKKQLIDFLQIYDDNQRIEIFDSGYGCIDITDVFGNEHHKSIVLS